MFRITGLKIKSQMTWQDFMFNFASKALYETEMKTQALESAYKLG